MECVSKDQLGPASSVPSFPELVLLVWVRGCVCVFYICDAGEMVTPANINNEVALLGIDTAELHVFLQRLVLLSCVYFLFYA